MSSALTIWWTREIGTQRIIGHVQSDGALRQAGKVARYQKSE